MAVIRGDSQCYARPVYEPDGRISTPADIGIRDGHIAAIGHLDAATARQTIDAAGLTVAPGFIDMLGQSEASILVKPHLPSKIYQGITTEITGEGSSAAPLTDALRKSDRAVGVSTSLQYAPAPYATTDELIALAAEGATLGGIYATHMRNEGDAIVPALQTVSGSTSQRTSGIALQMLKMSGLPCCSDLWARTGSWHSPHRPLVPGRTL